MRKQRMMIRTLSNSNNRILECEVMMTAYHRLWTSGCMGLMVHSPASKYNTCQLQTTL